MARKSDDNDLLFAVLAFALLLPSAAWSGFVLTRLWVWFVVPLGVAPITVWQAAGLFAVATWMSGAHSDSSDNDKDKPASLAFMTAAMKAVFVPLIIWGVCAIYHSLMV